MHINVDLIGGRYKCLPFGEEEYLVDLGICLGTLFIHQHCPEILPLSSQTYLPSGGLE